MTNRLLGSMMRFSLRRGLALVALTLIALMLSIPSAFAQEDPGQEGEKAPAAASPKVTVATNDGRIDSVLAVISSQISGTVSPFGKVPGSRVTIIAEEQPIETVLNQLANPNGWVWWSEDNGDYGIADREYYERNILPKRVIQKVFRPNNIKASELDRAIKNLITPNVGSSVADDRTNKLIVNDLPQALERIERFIREIDVQLVVRVFYIRHADVEDIAKKIENYKSDPGTIEVDTKTHQIIVTDLLSNIKKMELLIDILDVGPEIVIYDVNNIGIEGKDLEDLKKIIDSIRTDDDQLLFEVNEKQGVFILEDVPEVHERVEQILKGFDQPVKQVLLQGEILSTAFDRTFSFGLKKFGIADDLFDASNQGAFGSNGIGPSTSDPATGQLPALSFTNIYEIFPNLTMQGGALTANYLNENVLFQYEAAYNDSSTRVLLQPRVLVKNQQTSRIFVGKETPYLTTYYNDSNNTTNSTRTTSQSTVTSGLTFEVTPSISNSYLIELELKIDNDEANVEIDKATGQRLVGRDRQQVETTLQIPSGQTRMIGGLVRNNDSDGSAGFPYLSSLPYIGSIFGNKTSSKAATNLMIFITPSIVEDVLPRSTSKDGRRGRLVTDYERVPGEFDLNLNEDKKPTKEEQKEGELEAPANEADLLSGDSGEETDMLKEIRESEKRRRDALESDTGAGNYTPSAGFGSTTLNSATGGTQTTAPAQRTAPNTNTQNRRIVRPEQRDQQEQQEQQDAPSAPVNPPTDSGNIDTGGSETTYR